MCDNYKSRITGTAESANVECCRDKMVSRFERCRANFVDASDLWSAAESSVHLLRHSASAVAHVACESGIGASASSECLPPTLAQHSRPATSSHDTGITTSSSVDVDSSETPEAKLLRLKRLKDHLTKHIQLFKPEQIAGQRQCTCETDRW